MSRTVIYSGLAPRASLAMGAVGAVIGGSMAVSRNMGRVRDKEITRDEAVRDVLRESGCTGFSTAMGTAVVSAAGLTGVLSLAGFVAAAVGARYLVDRAVSRQGQKVRASAQVTSGKTEAVKVKKSK
jgi:hypothetical protein